MPPASCFLFLGSFFSVTGKSSGPDISHSIVSGDNFISPAVKEPTAVSVALASLLLGSDYSDVKRFNSTTQIWESYAQGQFSQFEPGIGYNIVGLTTASFSYGSTQQTTTMVYDSTGARTKKQVTGGATTVYLGKDYEVEGSKTTKYIFLGDRRIAVNSKLNTQNSELYFIHTDHINSSNIVTDSSGNQSILLEYDPYGETVTQTGSADLKHKYTGQERDDSTHLYYYGARYYDPQIGRFVTADPTVQHPIDPQDLNRYAYGRNNPIKYTDPTGLGFWSFLGNLFGQIFGAVVGGVVSGGNPAAIELGRRIGGAIGTSAGRTLETMFAGGSLREAVMGGINGFSEGWYSKSPIDFDILRSDPETQHFSKQTRMFFSQGLGLNSKVSDMIATSIENTIFKNNRSYGEIVNARMSSAGLGGDIALFVARQDVPF